MQNASNKPKSTEGHGFEAIMPGASQTIAYSTNVAATNNLQPRTSVVRLVATSDCWVSFNAAAVVGGGASVFIPKNTVCMLGVPQIFALGVQTQQKINAIQDSAGGNLYITEGD
jgi:hypothetical protein